ncbi:hypothetical protein C900_02864 [Fulvivirga imtechensis AK7]|uniref:Glycosyltransferase RgtA/B/C/D-like domain-containing protein n=1 Tax=Fulvivirga imtechensis AK7 TaxID=1237149 RepID=L8JUN2_9BACT|nr:hypothetical protein [Fulvivirga imtechensis]ELR71249.1 hypothetical protein C900_02864 [Fulvivirga imtechensis AK7]
MELKDFVVTPIVLFIVYVLAYIIRPRVTDHNTRRYFIPALTVKIIGAIAVGLIYQFYYGGGDTFNYFHHGSAHIIDAFKDNLIKGVRLIFSNGEHEASTYLYSSQIWYFKDSASFFMVKIVAIIDLFTFHTYSATACIIAALSFSGIWALYMVFYDLYPQRHLHFAIISFFIPSLFFWGSGVLKDSVTIGALGWITYAVFELFVKRKNIRQNGFVLLVAGYVLFSIKKYTLLVFLPAAIIWLYIEYFQRIRSLAKKVISFPIVVGLAVLSGYYGVFYVAEGDEKYALGNLAETAKITAYDIRYFSGRDAGSGYDIGELDGTFQGMMNLAPQAIIVSLFRPFPWEANNVLMLLSSFESQLVLILTIYVIVFELRYLLVHFRRSHIIFCFLFSITFAFAVGVSTFNFGTLVRYKIPLLPFYLAGLIMVLEERKRFFNRPAYLLNENRS